MSPKRRKGSGAARKECTFFFDECVSIRLQRALHALGETTCHLTNTQGFEKGMKDEVWLPMVVERGWFVVTRDTAMKKQASFLRQVRKHKAAVFMLKMGQASLWEQAEALVRNWPAIKQIATDERKHPFIAYIKRRGRVELEIL